MRPGGRQRNPAGWQSCTSAPLGREARTGRPAERRDSVANGPGESVWQKRQPARRARRGAHVAATGSAASSGAPVLEADSLEAGAVRAAWNAAALRDRATVDLLDVAGEVDRRGAADVRSDRVGIDRRLGIAEEPNALRVEAAGHDDLHVVVAGLVEAGPDLVDEIGRDPAPFARRVEPDAIEPVAEGLRDAECLFRLVLERVHEHEPGDIGLHIAIEGFGRGDGVAED